MARRASNLRATSPSPSLNARRCDAPGCENPGEFRAPRDRSRLRDYYWFCLEHVRAYNQAWDFYKGLSPEEIEIQLRDDTGWQRPTWPLGRLGANGRIAPEMLKDPLSLFGEAPPQRQKSAREAPPELRAALDIMGLGWPLTSDELRGKYKELAKRLHPDHTGGDKVAEEKLKDINRAYSLLRARLAQTPNPGTTSAATPRPSGERPATSADRPARSARAAAG